MKRRGFISLQTTLAVAALLIALQWLMLRNAETARLAILRDRDRLEGRILARNCMAYARAQLLSHRWNGSAVSFTSPMLGAGTFTAEVTPWHILSGGGYEFISRENQIPGKMFIRVTGRVEHDGTPFVWVEEAPLP